MRLGCEQALRLEGIPTRAVASAEAALREVGDGFSGVVIKRYPPARHRRHVARCSTRSGRATTSCRWSW
ncbi:hypothetical protein ACU4GD_03690 [Cupriavidus basilensis]